MKVICIVFLNAGLGQGLDWDRLNPTPKIDKIGVC